MSGRRGLGSGEGRGKAGNAEGVEFGLAEREGSIGARFDFHIRERPHMALGGRTPSADCGL
jgi:hypothetical protein